MYVYIYMDELYNKKTKHIPKLKKDLSVTILCLIVLMFATSLFHCMIAFGILGAFGSMWSNIFGCFHENPGYMEFNESDYWLGLLGDNCKHKILWHLQTTQGEAMVVAGFMGCFYKSWQYGASGVSVPFGMLIVLSIVGLAAVHLLLGEHCKEVDSLQVVQSMTGIQNMRLHNNPGQVLISTSVGSSQPLLTSQPIYGGVHTDEHDEKQPLIAASASGNATSTNDPRFTISGDDEDDEETTATKPGTENVPGTEEAKRNNESKSKEREAANAPTSLLDDGNNKKQTESASINASANANINVNANANTNTNVNVNANPQMQIFPNDNGSSSWLKYFPLLAGGYFENLETEEEHVLDESLLGFIVAYLNSRIFLCLLFIALCSFVLLFAFDVLFPSFSSIPASEGGMGWTPAYVGLFYSFYSATWLFTMWYRWYRLHMGYQWSTSVLIGPLHALKIAFGCLAVVYGLVFPWFINSPHIHHAEWGPSSWVFQGFLIAVIMGFLSAVVPYDVAQLFRDFTDTVHGESVQTSQQLRLRQHCSINHIYIYAHTYTHIYIFFFEVTYLRNKQHNNSRLAIIESKMTIQILMSTLLVYIRICAPVLIQWMFIWGWDMNSRVSSKHVHVKRDWYQIGNFVFYTLAFISAAGFGLVVLFEKWRREDFGEEVDNEEMTRLIEEVRRERNRSLFGEAAEIDEDSDAMGFWLSTSMKSCIGRQTRHPVCKTVQVCMKDNFEKWRLRQSEQRLYNAF
ncbi:hypothetical protein RFI_26160 [Reticulomyxa filosa]|uniref:Uncharacterized protein n=1 Tax=Reticulomyxa filosa TaxID=46433 RepID=X6MDU8_RETFI|nr:hypothetical protein RFI_26160 [Reticulomyxa filosa]|eukprot:ETO11215.1 hypothetical protein RFI_26160 [Reticulomyxa filosa]